jgi:hypothetical protein
MCRFIGGGEARDRQYRAARVRDIGCVQELLHVLFAEPVQANGRRHSAYLVDCQVIGLHAALSFASFRNYTRSALSSGFFKRTTLPYDLLD